MDFKEIDWREQNRVTAIKERTFRKNKQGENMYCSASYSTVTSEIVESSFAKETGRLLNFSSAMIRECSSDPVIMDATNEKPNLNCEGGYLKSAFTYA